MGSIPKEFIESLMEKVEAARPKTPEQTAALNADVAQIIDYYQQGEVENTCESIIVRHILFLYAIKTKPDPNQLALGLN